MQHAGSRGRDIGEFVSRVGIGGIVFMERGFGSDDPNRKAGKPYTIQLTIGDWHGTDVDEYLRQERGSWVSPTYVEVMDQALFLAEEDLVRLRKGLDERIEQEEEIWDSRSNLPVIDYNL